MLIEHTRHVRDRAVRVVAVCVPQQQTAVGFEVGEARVGRLVELDLPTDDRDQALTDLERMCEQLLTNPLIESYAIELDR